MLNTLPDLHRSFAEQLKLKLQSDSRIHSFLAGGSFIHGGFDQYSDLDFVVVIDPLPIHINQFLVYLLETGIDSKGKGVHRTQPFFNVPVALLHR
ncbi:hypothetical protein GCM10009795_056660 [Nocardioides hankookensis]|jgi:hypothetical protein|nr:hypothetical protein BCB66_03120 [Klebsiella pneumoniae]PLC87209.1 hypothetical protein B6I43_17530 [Klebsiella pneumoniae]SSH77800.1 plasmid-like protein [Klebsiella pneumoniae]SSJ64074.1 plasmid-like protein [Klebsiella pneumoniae]SSM03142.1 plasmid-like protein [Klebsiella pneumoniae]